MSNTKAMTIFGTGLMVILSIPAILLAVWSSNVQAEYWRGFLDAFTLVMFIPPLFALLWTLAAFTQAAEEKQQ